jgi:hypothetical protein
MAGRGRAPPSARHGDDLLCLVRQVVEEDLRALDLHPAAAHDQFTSVCGRARRCAQVTRSHAAAYATDAMKRAAVGFREHTGWATMVAVGGSERAPVVVARDRFELCDEHQPRAVYHVARDLDLAGAERLVREVEVGARRAAERQLQRVAEELEAGGYRVVGAAVASDTRMVPTDIFEILASHPLVHTAEGQLFRGALAGAAELRGLPMTRFVWQDLYEQAAAQIGTSDESLRAQLTGLGRALGPPWQRDQKEAAAAAWLALACAGPKKRTARAARQR